MDAQWSDLEQGGQAPRRGASAAGSPIVNHARTLLAVLTTLGTFGASLSFSTLNSNTSSSSRTLLAWSFAAFIFGSAETLVFQVALVADFGSRTAHRVYRSQAGILTGLGIGFTAVFSGTICLTLSMVASPIAGVRAAGCAVSILLALMVAGSLTRLAYTIGSRVIQSSGIPGSASIDLQTPHAGSVTTLGGVPVERGWESENDSSRGRICQGQGQALDTESCMRDNPSASPPEGRAGDDVTTGSATMRSPTPDNPELHGDSLTASSSAGSVPENVHGGSQSTICLDDPLHTDISVHADNTTTEPARGPTGLVEDP